MKPTPTLPRDRLLTRLADVIGRAGVEDGDEIVRLLEKNLPPRIQTVDLREVERLITADNAIQAVVAYREKTGAGLREAVEALHEIDCEMAVRLFREKTGRGLKRAVGMVELMVRRDAPDDENEEFTCFARFLNTQRVLKTIGEKRMIEAIRDYRAATGCGLAVAKEAVQLMHGWMHGPDQR